MMHGRILFQYFQHDEYLFNEATHMGYLENFSPAYAQAFLV